MTVHIKYFGLITEATGCSQEDLEFEGKHVQELLEELYKKYPVLNRTDFKVAQGKGLVNETELITGEEIALLPPFSGG